MRQKGNRPRGVTLAELIVTLAIASIFLYVVGSLFIYTQTAWTSALRKAGAEDNLRYCFNRMEYIIRQATGPAVLSPGGPAYTSLKLTSSKNASNTYTFQITGGNLTLNGSEILLPGATNFNFTVAGTSSGTYTFNVRQNVNGSLRNARFTIRCRNLN